MEMFVKTSNIGLLKPVLGPNNQLLLTYLVALYKSKPNSQ